MEPQPDQHNPDEQRRAHPAIRTMASDIQNLLRTNPPSISQIAAKQPSHIQVQTQPQSSSASRHHYKGLFFFSIGLCVIIASVAGAVWLLLPDGTFKESIRLFPNRLVFTPQTPAQPGPAEPPAPLFQTEVSRTITIPNGDRAIFLKLVNDTLKEREAPGTFKRILIKLERDGKERFAGLEDFFDFWRITAPPRFFDRMDPVFMFFIFSGPDGPRAGFAARTHDRERTFSDILSWEPSLLAALRPLFFNEEVVVPDPYSFEDRAYRNIDWRYLKLSPQRDLGIAHMIFPAQQLVVFGTSKEEMETIIKRLLDAR